MDKSSYQMLRFAVESEVYAAALQSGVVATADTDSLVNALMLNFVRCISAEKVKSQRLRREFKTFRRSPDVKPPSWAYRKPGIDSRLPTL